VAPIRAFTTAVAVVVAVTLVARAPAGRQPAQRPSLAIAPTRGVALASSIDGSETTPAYGTYAWPVNGPVIRPFEPPPDPYAAGHRGIDIAVPFGTPMVAAQDGTVAFAGWVGGQLFISIDHADGVRTTYSWISAVSVKKGDVVRKGSVIGATGHGHPDVATPHLHFGARIGSTYIDPMLLLARGSVVGLIRLAPLGGARDGVGLEVRGPSGSR